MVAAKQSIFFMNGVLIDFAVARMKLGGIRE
jgi:hypothetical protein